jgi:hypothetical protein
MRLTKLMVLILGLTALLAVGCGGSPTPNASAPTADKPTEGRATGPMPDDAFKAAITVADPPTKMRLGERATLMVKVKNLGTAVWPSMGRASDGYFQVNVGDRWYDNKNTLLDKHHYERVGLGRDVKPGEEVEVALIITAPSVAGEYALQIDLVQEMVAWFAEKNNASPKFKVSVQG